MNVKFVANFDQLWYIISLYASNDHKKRDSLRNIIRRR